MVFSLIEQSPPILLKYVEIKSHGITRIEIILLLQWRKFFRISRTFHNFQNERLWK